MNPKEEFYKLLEEICDKVDIIDENTPWSEVEPQWWLDMMEIRRKVVNSKLKERKLIS